MLVRGVAWSAAGPALSFASETTHDVDAPVALPLAAGTWLRFRAEPGVRRCLGYSKVADASGGEHFPCPDAAPAQRGFMCGSCFGRDDFRFMHDFHRSGIAPAGLKKYLAQEHWLYIATFADGSSKVGTAASGRKWLRLAEQGAVVAQYVALAEDGRVVRLLEDAVSSGISLPQQVRAATKASALLKPLPSAELQARNDRWAAAARELVAAVNLEKFTVVTEAWEPPSLARDLRSPGSRHAYSLSLTEGDHGFLIGSILGGFALVRLDGTDAELVVNLNELKGHMINFGDYSSEVPTVQDALF